MTITYENERREMLAADTALQLERQAEITAASYDPDFIDVAHDVFVEAHLLAERGFDVRFQAVPNVNALSTVDQALADGEVARLEAMPVGEGAAAPATDDITEIGFAEFVASALGKRPFDDEKVNAQSAGAVFKNLPKMQRDALKMQRDVQKSIDEGNAADEGGADDGAADYADEGSTADYGDGN